MKEYMFLIIALIVASVSMTHCTNVATDQASTTVIQNSKATSVNSQVEILTPEAVLENEELINANKKVASEKDHLKPLDNNQLSEVADLIEKKVDPKSTVKEPKSKVIEKEVVREELVNQNPQEAKQPETSIKEIEKSETTEEAMEITEEQVAIVPKQVEAVSEKEAVEDFDDQAEFNHNKWHTILQANVSQDGKVNYKGIKSSVTQFDSYLELLSQNTPQNSWSANKTKAYWINAYNAFTIKLILNNMPVASITDLEGGKPWDKKWINLGGETYSLNDIEHVILRPTYNDPRIHFAVNCAAKSCPKVWNNAWTEQNIESALDKLSKEFIANTSANQISEKKVSLSKIFEWYKEDFGDLIQFLNKYSSTKISPKAKITFNDYNWKLNS